MQPEKFDTNSQSIKALQLEKLRALFPEVITEAGKIDFDKLKNTLGEHVDSQRERYGMSWPGKADCFKVIQAQSRATLIPQPEESLKADGTIYGDVEAFSSELEEGADGDIKNGHSDHIFIEGDNLEVLKLLQKSYLGKVKMIYIDPPYNTGKEFVYSDNFNDSMQNYLEYTGQVDGDGRKMSTNTDTDGRYHSNWLNMMYPRLFLAKNLLREDGVIFISIDDNEQANLKKLCDEIFGEENFVEIICWNKRIPKNDKGIGNIHEYIFIYVKDVNCKHEFLMEKEGLEEIDLLLNQLKRTNTKIPIAEIEIKKLYKKKAYDRGITLYNSLDYDYNLWGKINLSWPNANTFGPKFEVKHPKTNKAVKIPDRGWRWKRATFDAAAKIIDGKYSEVIELHDGSFRCGNIWFANDENTQPSSISYLNDLNSMLLRSIISMKSDGGIEIEKLFDGKSYFSYPKPTSIVKILLKSLSIANSDVILDFFAGSATTAHAVMDLNKEDGGNRKYIMVQLPEATDESSEAHKAGYKKISDISKERIRRVSTKIKNELLEERSKAKNGDLFAEDSKESKAPLDLGFRAFKLAPSNFKAWDTNIDKDAKTIEKQLELFVDHVDESKGQEALLYELLLKSGFALTTEIERLTIAGLSVYSIEDKSLFICLEQDITQEVIEGMAEQEPIRAICLDEGFKENDQLKANAVKIFEGKGVRFMTV